LSELLCAFRSLHAPFAHGFGLGVGIFALRGVLCFDFFVAIGVPEDGVVLVAGEFVVPFYGVFEAGDCGAIQAADLGLCGTWLVELAEVAL
jgi:hypothetical protein